MWWIVSGGKESSHGRGGLLLPCNFIESHLNLKTELITLYLHLWLYLFNKIEQFWLQDIRSKNDSKDLEPLGTKDEIKLSLWLGEKVRNFIFLLYAIKVVFLLLCWGTFSLHKMPFAVNERLHHCVTFGGGDILRNSFPFSMYVLAL